MSTTTTTWGGRLAGLEDCFYGADRRRTPRYDIKGSAEALIRRTDGTSAITGIELLDSSATGLGILSRIPADLGDEVNVHWDHSPLAGRRGTVARCEPVALETGEIAYRLGLSSAAVAAA